MAEEKRSTQENEFEESQTNDTEKEEVNSEKHQGEAHKKKEDESCHWAKSRIYSCNRMWNYLSYHVELLLYM